MCGIVIGGNIVPKGRQRKIKGKKSGSWVLKVTVITFVLAAFLSFLSESVMRGFDNIIFPILILLVIIFIGVLFDTIGIAVAAAEEVSFVAMASKKIPGARESVNLVKNADQVSNFCNDVIGDICGILSGAAGGILVARSLIFFTGIESIIQILIISLIASLTVGGKAIGKKIAIKNSRDIVFKVGYIVYFTRKLYKKMIPFKRKNGA